jgi:hypothetical protein
MTVDASAEIHSIKPYNSRYFVIMAEGLLAIADLETQTVSKLSWIGAGSEKFLFYGNIVIVSNAGELSVIEIGNDIPIGSCRSEYINPYLISVIITKKRRVISYLSDPKTIAIQDLNSGAVWDVTSETKVDWLEVFVFLILSYPGKAKNFFSEIRNINYASIIFRKNPNALFWTLLHMCSGSQKVRLLLPKVEICSMSGTPLILRMR